MEFAPGGDPFAQFFFYADQVFGADLEGVAGNEPPATRGSAKKKRGRRTLARLALLAVALFVLVWLAILGALLTQKSGTWSLSQAMRTVVVVSFES